MKLTNLKRKRGKNSWQVQLNEHGPRFTGRGIVELHDQITKVCAPMNIEFTYITNGGYDCAFFKTKKDATMFILKANPKDFTDEALGRIR